MAARAIWMMRVAASATVIPVFFWLWVSLAETPMQNSSTPHAWPRSSPFSLRTRPESRTRDGLAPGWLNRWNSLSVSAIWGTFSGLTNEPSWMTSTPDSISASTQANLCSNGTVCFSACRPSRSPTS